MERLQSNIKVLIPNTKIKQNPFAVLNRLQLRENYYTFNVICHINTEISVN